MSENGVMDRPRRSTRSSLAAATGVTPATPPTSSSNPYKKPTYYSSGKATGETPTARSNGTSGRGRGRGRPPGRSSTSRGGAHTKPECVAVRVDGRRSTGGSTASSGGRRGAASGGRRSTYTSSRHEYEYHYGSDFESDQNESELEEELESEHEESEGDDSIASLQDDNDNAESDSDFSVSSTRISSRLPSPPVPIWLDTEKVPDIPKLELPHSSDDLLLSREHVVKAVEIYEPLRRFHQLVRLSPFRFEDFCAALACDDQSSLLAEIHIQLLKSVIREEDANGTLFGPNEVKDSVQSVVYFIDHITWPESLRSYLESDPTWSDVYDALISVEYPFCEPDVRIKVLGLLVDQFLTTSWVREQLLGEGTIKHEDHCRACNRLGELICCESCPAVYHLECITPALKDYDDLPDDWRCSVCTKHQIQGVNDCTSEVERMGLLIRHERLGYDRHGRKYWFLVRRILVESEDGSEVWYYSTRTQIDELYKFLDGGNYESSLISNIKAIEDEIFRQMEVTEEVTRIQNTQRRKTYLDVENGKDDGADGAERMTRLKATGLYKLGQEGLFRTYSNHYTLDPLALPKGKQNEERDRKRHMSHKFSLTTASECKFGIKDITGCTRSTQVSALKNALTHMEAILPTTLMHVNWPVLRKNWLADVQTGYHPIDFSRALIMISSCIRNAVYNPVWSESMGHVRLSRMTQLEREERKKAEKRDKKDKDDEEDRFKAEKQFIKYTLPIRHQVYKQKGEEYRLHGRWGWIWLSNMRRCKSQDCRKQGLLAGPHKHVIQVKNETGTVKTMLIDPGVYYKLMAKRVMTANANSSSKIQDSTATTSTANIKPASPEAESSADQTEPDVKDNSDVEMKEEVQIQSQPIEEDKKQEEVQTDSSASDMMKVELGEEAEGEVESQMEDDIQSNEGIMEPGDEKVVELKIEPMDVDEKGEDDVTEVHSSNTVDSVGKSEEKDVKIEVEHSVSHGEPMQTKADEVNGNEAAMEAIEDKQPDISERMETDDLSHHENEDQMVAEQTRSTTPVDKPNVNGSSEEVIELSPQVTDPDPEKEDTENAVITEEKKPIVSPSEVKSESQISESKNENVVDKQTTTAATSDQQQETPPLAGNHQGSVAQVTEKSDTTQERKFKTDLVNVSAGLASTHRVLYPKVAKRCDYLDTLLQRKLTLRSLEEKTLNSEYGEEIVLKAKTGIAEFEEEEKKRALEADEYPGEEIIDNNLTLGGAYAFCCYSSECRKEALLFMKTKGKNRERLYEKICYSPMCRLKFCLQETVRIKQEKMREFERDRLYKIYKEIEARREYTAEGTSQKVYMKKIPDCVADPGSSAICGQSPLKGDKKRYSRSPGIKYPEVSGFQYFISKKPSILVLSPFELRKLSRTAGRTWTPTGFFQNLKSGSWGWNLPCGRPVFRTAWQYKTTHSRTLGAAAMQLRILYASIRWDDILAKIPNTEGKHQIHTDTEIITTEILEHRIVGRFMEKVQYLRKMMVVPIDAPKTIREITPSRIGLRKRKRAECPDKMDPVVSEEWVDEEKLELWEIRYYGDRMDRRLDRKSEGGTPSSSTRTKSGILLKQPEKYDPSRNIALNNERKSYPPAHPQNQTQKENHIAGAPDAMTTNPVSSIDSAIEHVIRNQELSASKTAEMMRETIESEMKSRPAQVSKRDKHGNMNGGQGGPVQQQTASQQFQLQQQQGGVKIVGQQQRNIAQIVSGTPTSSKVGSVVVGKKFFAHRQANAMNNIGGADAALLTKRPMQNTIIINKGASGTASITKNPALSSQNNPQQQSSVQQQTQPLGTPVTTAIIVANNPAVSGGQQRLTVLRYPDGRCHVKGLLPGQSCFQTPDGKIHLSSQVQQVQQTQQQAGGVVQAQATPGQLAPKTPTPSPSKAVESSSATVVVQRPTPPVIVSTPMSNTSLQQQSPMLSSTPIIVSNNAAASGGQQKLFVLRYPDGKCHIKELLPGQSCIQTPDGKIILSSQVQQLQQTQQQVGNIVQVQASPGQLAPKTPSPSKTLESSSTSVIVQQQTPPVVVSTSMPNTSLQQSPMLSSAPIIVSNNSAVSGGQQKLFVLRYPDGKCHIKELLPGQNCFQTQDGKIILSSQVQQLQQTQQQVGNMVQVQGTPIILNNPAVSGGQQKVSVVRYPDGRCHIKELLPGQSCIQTSDGKIILSSQVQQLKQTTQQLGNMVQVQGSPIIVANSPSVSGGQQKVSLVRYPGQSCIQTPDGKIILSPQVQQLQQQVQVPATPGELGQNTASPSKAGESSSTSGVLQQQASSIQLSTPVSNASVQQQEISVKQSPMLSATPTSTSIVQQSSPIVVLRSAPPATVSNPSPLTSPVPRSPPPPIMVSPAKILSPPGHVPSMLSASKAYTLAIRQEAASGEKNAQSVPSSPAIASPSPPVIIARKSAPRKSPHVKTNNLDSPPQIMSPPPVLPPPVHNTRGMNSVAAELMKPLSQVQQHTLNEKKNELREEIEAKKKAAVTQMKLGAQREIQELEKAKADEIANASKSNAVAEVQMPVNHANSTSHNHNNSLSESEPEGPVGGHYGGRGKKRKMKTNSRNSTDISSTSAQNSGGAPKGGRSKKKRKLFCICETPYDKTKFYVGCDKCDNWFHGDCVGITEEMSKDLQEYICAECRGEDKVYCLCKKPYNDLQFYIQCDKCDDWFHGRCIGVLQGEADSIGDYCCPACEPNSDINAPNGKQLDATDYLALSRLLRELLVNRSSIPFRKPVSKAQAPNYYAIIKEPMDLQTVQNRVDERQYGKLRDFIGDVVKIFENCRYYNDNSTDTFRQAENLEKFFVQKICTLRQSLRARQRIP